MRKRWLSGRAIGLHGLLVTVAPLCLLAGWWQVHRALSGNFLSYLYSVEWPAFAVIAGFGWWQLIHDVPLEGEPSRPGRPERRPSAGRGEDFSAPPLTWDVALESPELRAYNDRLRQLAEKGGRKTWGNPRGLPKAADDGATDDRVADDRVADDRAGVP